MSSKENEEPAVFILRSFVGQDVITETKEGFFIRTDNSPNSFETDLWKALDCLVITAHQQESIVKQLTDLAAAVDTNIAAAAMSYTTQQEKKKPSSCGFEKLDQIDKEYQNDEDSQKFKADDDDDDDADDDAYDDEDDDDDDSNYDGNVQYPYHPQSKI
tara:strand:- start:580 stop:1056 length:477 start_codon:yes stop_codon:yes gene_type:complete